MKIGPALSIGTGRVATGSRSNLPDYRPGTDSERVAYAFACGLRPSVAREAAKRRSEIMAITGHQSLEEVEHYTRAVRIEVESLVIPIKRPLGFTSRSRLAPLNTCSGTNENLTLKTEGYLLSVAHKPYFRLIEPGLHLGFRKLASGPGTWVVRRYSGDGKYSVVASHEGDGAIKLVVGEPISRGRAWDVAADFASAALGLSVDGCLLDGLPRRLLAKHSRKKRKTFVASSILKNPKTDIYTPIYY